MAYGLAFTQAIYVLVFVGDKTQAGQMEYAPTPLIADTLNIPKPSVVKILQLLGQAGIIESGAGKHGGIRLAEAPRHITLDRVFEAIEGKRPLFRLDHYLNVDGERPRSAAAEITHVLSGVESTMRTALGDYSLEDFLVHT